jgi:mono/diheme cytochrome c family protein
MKLDIEKFKEIKGLIAALIVLILVFGYLQFAPLEADTRGEQLYLIHCVECHGAEGVGENPENVYAKDEFGYVAPPMDDTGHAWHHTDEQLTQMIMGGSPRNPRMEGFKHVLNEEDAGDLVEYIKSLWSPYIRENCQGPKHMSCQYQV